MCIFFSIYFSFLDIFTFSFDSRFGNVKSCFLKLAGIKLQGKFFAEIGFRVFNPKNITIGHNCSFGHYNKIWAFNEISIGDHVQTALGLTIISGSHNSSNYEPLLDQKVIIEGENWIGANVTILGGVTIGRGSIIGAGSVVNKNIPAYSIAAGVPARVIKDRVPDKLVVNPFGNYIPSYHLPDTNYNRS